MVDNIVNKVASARARVDAGHKRDHHSAVFKLEFAPTKMIPLKNSCTDWLYPGPSIKIPREGKSIIEDASLAYVNCQN